MVSRFSNLYWDYSVEHTIGTPSIEIKPSIGDNNLARECDLRSTIRNNPVQDVYPINPGDHIVFTCWIKVDNGTPQDYSGARLGIDLNGIVNGVRVNLYGLQSSSYPTTPMGEVDNYVHWGTAGWVQKTIDFIVPSETFNYDNYMCQSISPTQICEIAPWMQVWNSYGLGQYEQLNAWFADPELYINP
jgi:hypothetical protein